MSLSVCLHIKEKAARDHVCVRTADKRAACENRRQHNILWRLVLMYAETPNHIAVTGLAPLLGGLVVWTVAMTWITLTIARRRRPRIRVCGSGSLSRSWLWWW